VAGHTVWASSVRRCSADCTRGLPHRARHTRARTPGPHSGLALRACTPGLHSGAPTPGPRSPVGPALAPLWPLFGPALAALCLGLASRTSLAPQRGRIRLAQGSLRFTTSAAPTFAL